MYIHRKMKKAFPQTHHLLFAPMTSEPEDNISQPNLTTILSVLVLFLMLYEGKIFCCNILIYPGWKTHEKTAFLGRGTTPRRFPRALYPNGQGSPLSLELQAFPNPRAKTLLQSCMSTCPGDSRVTQSKGPTFCLEITVLLQLCCSPGYPTCWNFPRALKYGEQVTFRAVTETEYPVW